MKPMPPPDMPPSIQKPQKSLPNSRLTLHFADSMHRYSRIKNPPTVPYIDTELNADRVTPVIPTPLSSRDYFAGRDPALEAILRHR